MSSQYSLFQHPALPAILFLLDCHSALFSPVKHPILPQHLRKNELIGGNGLIEAGTFVAILVGALTGSLPARTMSRFNRVISNCSLMDRRLSRQYRDRRELHPIGVPQAFTGKAASLCGGLDNGSHLAVADDGDQQPEPHHAGH